MTYIWEDDCVEQQQWLVDGDDDDDGGGSGGGIRQSTSSPFKSFIMHPNMSVVWIALYIKHMLLLLFIIIIAFNNATKM